MKQQSEYELTREMIDEGIWNIPVDKTYWNRTDFSEGGLNVRKLCRKLDLMLGRFHTI